MIHHSQAMTRSTNTMPAAMISPSRVAGSWTQAISGSKVRNASSRKPVAIARKAHQQEGGHGATRAVRRCVRGRPHSRGRTMVTAASKVPRLA
jgi:hypothetical protein